MKADKINATDLVHHQQLLGDLGRAQKLQRDLSQYGGIEGAVNYWQLYLKRKYKLPDGVFVDLEGTIQRP